MKKIRLKIQGALIGIAVITMILFSKFLFPRWKGVILDTFLDIIGIALILFGLLFRIAARGYKSEISPDGKKLVIGGLYSIMRNPMYFGTFLVGIGITLMLFEWWVFILFSVICLLIYIPQVNKESNYLSKHFGKEYADYCRKTPKYFPKFISFIKGDLNRCLFFKRSWLRKEIASFIGIFLAITIIEMWQDIRLFGGAEFFKELLKLCLISGSLLTFIIIFYGKEKI